MKVLIAEDDELQAAVLRTCLERWGHEAICTRDGTEAWQKFQDSADVSLVISDWMMPGLDGPELVRRIRAARRPGYVYVILLTARLAREDLVHGMEAGADDFLAKPFDREELRVRLRAGERVVRLEQDLARRNTELEAVNTHLRNANRRMKRDLNAAARVQRALLPDPLPNSATARFAWAFRPCDELAGDLLGVVPLTERHTALYVLDVSGHGVASALLSVSVRRFLSPPPTSSLLCHAVDGPELWRVTPPAGVAAELNRHFPFDEDTGQYFTLLYGVLDRETFEFRYVTAGHPGPIYIDGNEAGAQVAASGLPIGITEAPTYRERTLQLHAGSRLYLYSDGIPEAANASGERFERDRLIAALQRCNGVSLQESVTVLLETVEQWCRPGRLKDDASLLAVEVGPAPNS